MLKKVWQKRKCRIKDGILSVSHSDVSRFFLHLIWGRLLVPSQFKNVLNLQTKVNNIFNFLVLHLCENNHENQTNVSKITKNFIHILLHFCKLNATCLLQLYTDSFVCF